MPAVQACALVPVLQYSIPPSELRRKWLPEASLTVHYLLEDSCWILNRRLCRAWLSCFVPWTPFLTLKSATIPKIRPSLIARSSIATSSQVQDFRSCKASWPQDASG